MRVVTLLAALICALSAWTSLAQAFEIEAEATYGNASASERLKIISTADIDLFAPVIEAFAGTDAGLAVDYTVVSSSELMRAIYDGGGPYDLAISSAMDLQTKLSNDGLTRAHGSAATDLVPGWAAWRGHVYAFSQEPAALVISPSAFDGLEVPRTRQDLITLLRDHADRFRGRVATYDIAASGLGYLFATQDARASETYWRLTEVMGNLETRLYCCSGQMIEKVSTGEIAVAYNVLGSYARARTDLADRIQVIELADYTTMMLRTAAILRDAQNPDRAGAFLDHLIRAAWGPEEVPYYPFTRYPAETTHDNVTYRPIRLGPGLLVYLDAMKRSRFLYSWQDAMRSVP